MLKLITFLAVSLMWAAQCHAAGFQSARLPGEGGVAIELAIWYPSASGTAMHDIGVTTQQVAIGGEVMGTSLPLIIVSHGTGGYAFSHYDTALALADAGFIVAALTHPGDNYKDQSRAVDILARPRHVTAAIDYMLREWRGRAALASDGIGIFGFSSGGFTALVNAGGIPDLARVPVHCTAHPGDFACRLLAEHVQRPIPVSSSKNLHDARIKAAVIAAPALGFTFDAAGLRNVNIPLQLWRAQDDDILPHPWYAEAVRHALPMAPEYHVVQGAGHFDFLAPCSEQLARIAPPICVSQAGFDRVAFHHSFNRKVVAFFSKALGKR
ncbi:alpha/beta hydrolase family protein [Pseudoduganella dura]|uniref:alpha/beta hydrolase family protein n=1 Tax=Pseudoduganella dura TaxID=321982 RepID=UPI001564519C|nr:dienelactone hydrolase [Pseudoduganella dura]GGY09251.1 dienelactone hydrolase [Pseudoduganella dura]